MTNETNGAGALPMLDTATIGAPLTRLGVSFFPIYLPGNYLPEIRTGEGSGLVVKELSVERVNTVRAVNPTDTPILLVEGEHLVGGKQNRVVNGSVLLAPGSARNIPVTCVEAGRWSYGDRPAASASGGPAPPDPARVAATNDPSFGAPPPPGFAPPDPALNPAPPRPLTPPSRQLRAGAAKAPRRLRRVVRSSVTDSLLARRGRDSDQGAAWNEVTALMRVHRSSSASSSAAEAEEQVFRRDHSRGDAVRALSGGGSLPGQCGVAVTHGDKVVSVEIFGAPQLLADHWASLVRSHLLDVPGRRGPPSASHALWGVRRPARMRLRRTPGLGLGTEFHAKDEYLIHHALTLDSALVHAATQFNG